MLGRLKRLELFDLCRICRGRFALGDVESKQLVAFLKPDLPPGNLYNGIVAPEIINTKLS